MVINRLVNGHKKNIAGARLKYLTRKFIGLDLTCERFLDLINQEYYKFFSIDYNI